jgi:hypothetical protein
MHVDLCRLPTLFNLRPVDDSAGCRAAFGGMIASYDQTEKHESEVEATHVEVSLFHTSIMEDDLETCDPIWPLEP